MISSENISVNNYLSNEDFTIDSYNELLCVAKRNYKFSSYENINWEDKFILWRHDIDYSLNRALVLAKIEKNQNVHATYFINPHSDFYNIAEVNQFKIVNEILSMGHTLGLHFEADFYDINSEEALEMFIDKEANYIENLFGTRPHAFSFHNPVEKHLKFDKDKYSGLVNCYSKRFKSEVSYCSDSNGYWRFKRLHDFLSDTKSQYLQVLTHPGWWQDFPMNPRSRIYRAVYGRAKHVMNNYDQQLVEYGRENSYGSSYDLSFLKNVEPNRHELFDYLYNNNEFDLLFGELWKIHLLQILRLCKVQSLTQISLPKKIDTTSDVNSFIDSELNKKFSDLFGLSLVDVSKSNEDYFLKYQNIFLKLKDQFFFSNKENLEDDCIDLCDKIVKLANWGLNHPVSYNGLISHDLLF